MWVSSPRHDGVTVGEGQGRRCYHFPPLERAAAGEETRTGSKEENVLKYNEWRRIRRRPFSPNFHGERPFSPNFHSGPARKDETDTNLQCIKIYIAMYVLLKGDLFCGDGGGRRHRRGGGPCGVKADSEEKWSVRCRCGGGRRGIEAYAEKKRLARRRRGGGRHDIEVDT
jgi:hypothetical protein